MGGIKIQIGYKMETRRGSVKVARHQASSRVILGRAAVVGNLHQLKFETVRLLITVLFHSYSVAKARIKEEKSSIMKIDNYTLQS